MKVTDFDYYLPEDLIAQSPASPRDSSRLMVVHKNEGSIEHRFFRDITDYMLPGDIMVVNDSRVIPARLIGHHGEAAIEVLLLKEIKTDVWECLVRPGKKFKLGAVITMGDGLLELEVVGITNTGERLLAFQSPLGVREAIHKLGTMPLPPYIKTRLEDPERYQTVYSRDEGSAAAPTAGLHFTDELMSKITEMGIEIVPVTLHVGLGTFRPVKSEDINEHHMHSEFFSITPEAAQTINNAKGRIWCIGTTSVRTLESATDLNGVVKSGSGWTDIFIYPGYKFKKVDVLVTNFHLPKSTLLMLISAFASREQMLDAYRLAVEDEYRFFSFGDAMLII